MLRLSVVQCHVPPPAQHSSKHSRRRMFVSQIDGGGCSVDSPHGDVNKPTRHGLRIGRRSYDCRKRAPRHLVGARTLRLTSTRGPQCRKTPSSKPYPIESGSPAPTPPPHSPPSPAPPPHH